MNVTLLDGALREDEAASRAREAIERIAARDAWRLTSFFLPELDIPPCAGDFKCWVRQPGVCAIDGPNRDIARATAQSDLAVWLTPVTFGGYSYHLKKALDHLIGNISPLFTFIDGEVHHKARYGSNPRLLALGTSSVRDEEAQHAFRTLVHRNAINMHAPGWNALFVWDGETFESLSARLQLVLGWLRVAS